VEEITAKTGSFKRFAVFVRMLLSAVRRESDSVCVDLLSPADLDLLRSKRASSSAAATEQPMLQQRPAATGQGSAGHPSSTKRYLILTYAAEFDRVHYPLPLAYEVHPDPQRLKATICQLRSQLAAATRPGGMHRRAPPGPMLASAAELMKLRDENAALRLQLQGIEAAGLGAHGASTGLAADVQQLAADAQETVQDLRAMRRERDGLLAKLQAAEAALDGERSLHRRELRRRAQEVADVTGELAAAKDQVRELRMKCRELMQELDLAQRRAKVASMG
jgi:coiled-coil domain-containing protein 61